MWSPPDWVATIERAEHSEAKRDAPFEPNRVRTACQQIEVTKNRRASIFRVQELVHEQMDGGSKGIQGKVPHVFRKGKQREGAAEREMCKRSLQCNRDNMSPEHPVRS